MVLAVTDNSAPAVEAPPATRIVLVVEYEGTRYCGYQLQAGQPSVQAELEKALEKLTGMRTRPAAASRTDTGVHARGQVISFKTTSALPLAAFIHGMNYHLPKDIAVRAAYKVREGFDVRRRAISREYRYYMLNRPSRSPLLRNQAYLVKETLDVEAMNRACQVLIGEHDFASFGSSLEAGRQTVRSVYKAEVRREDEMVVFTIIASSFLPHQVRNTVGALIEVGAGRMSLDEFCSIMDAKKPGLVGPAAPACGLFLVKVNYPRPLEEELL